MLTRRTVRTAPLLVMLLAAGAVLSGCVFSAEPAPGSPASPQGYSTEGFPPPTPPAPGELGQPEASRPPAAPAPEEGP